VKFYIHHYYNKSIFYKIAHNTTERRFFITDKVGSVFCKYKNTNIEFIFKQEISFENDGFHLLDYFTALFYGQEDPKIGHIERDNHYMERETQQILTIYNNLLKYVPVNQKWIITYFRTEKILQTNDTFNQNDKWLEIENLLNDLGNHYVVTDNIFLNDYIETKHSNLYYSLTNTVFQWNEIIGIRWFYEFKQIYDKLNFDYDLMYSFKNHKKNRVEIAIELDKIKNNKILIQRSDSLKNPDYLENTNLLNHINTNSVVGNNDFSDLTYIDNHKGYMDMFFRVLPKAKMQILCESWSWSRYQFTSQYLSEKTFILILSGIPFISTHEYPLQILQKMLDLPPHPFYGESLKCKTNGKLFANFVQTFMKDFENNFKLCKNWSDLAHLKLIKMIENDNSLLDIVIKGFKKEITEKQPLI
jgi:hypothetical protein